MLSKSSEIFSQKEVFSVSHMAEAPWQVQHHFETPAKPEAIQQAEDDIGIVIPETLKDFWLMSDGAVLYKSLEAPDWGWRVLSTDRYLEKQHKWRRKFFDYWKMEFLVLAELVKPHSAVVWNSQNDDVLYLDPSSLTMKEVNIAEGVDLG